MARAQYAIQVPAEARGVAVAAHNYITSTVKGIHSATVMFGHPHDSLVVVGEETPELDSHMKQTAAFIGELANAQVINVTKHGSKTLAHWPIRNPSYQPPPPSPPPAVFAQPSEAPLPSSGAMLPMAVAAT